MLVKVSFSHVTPTSAAATPGQSLCYCQRLADVAMQSKYSAQAGSMVALQVLTGKSIVLELPPSSTVADVKVQLHAKEGECCSSCRQGGCNCEARVLTLWQQFAGD